MLQEFGGAGPRQPLPLSGDLCQHPFILVPPLLRRQTIPLRDLDRPLQSCQ
jgi:hypothetical protein